MLLGKVLAQGAMQEGKFVTWLPAYGAEVRGGTAHCMVIISDKEIGSPYINKADTLIIMNQPSFVKFKNRIGHNGLLVLNSSLVENYAHKSLNILQFPFTDIAADLGNVKIANMAAVGCFIAYKKQVKLDSILKAIEIIAPADKKELVEINCKALLEGVDLVK